MAAIRDERIFTQGNIEVTSTLVRVGGMSYPINGIGSVYIGHPRVVGWYVIGGVLALFGIAQIGQPGGASAAGGLLVVAALIVMFAASRPSFLVLRTASGDQQAVKSKDKSLLASVKAAIEQAVAHRG